MKDRDHDEAMAELFKDDPAFATEYLNQILQDGEPGDLLVALRQAAERWRPSRGRPPRT
jgi:DNA-binding phage protein